jgi:hypothetical protein
MRPSSVLKAAVPIAGALGAGWLVNRLLWHPYYVYWGATTEEIFRAMPLDERVPAPSMNTTMAISINAAPEDVWPWVAQMGDPPRAGYYSYTWIERLLGMHIQNADAVLDSYQRPEVGEALDRNGTMVVQAVEPGQSLVLGPPPSVDWIRCTWAFGIYPGETGETRLVTRVRADWSWRQMLARTPPPTWPLYLFIEPGAFVMERKMLIEIKRRAENLAQTRLPATITEPRQPARTEGAMP